ncbi:GyrI-like domain-containing protein [Sorangium sp. So ce176]|uniref:GyrI-like domain-containing protein n=1 Tax=Sorangium sp. So ce176 TaxID=3133286 RepID=UPI003F5FF95C
MSKVDLKRELKHLYQPSAKEVVQVDVPAFQFLMIDGEGDPNTSQAYAEAVEALFSVAYTTKFMVKKGAQGIDYAVMPLEGLWWSDDMSVFTSNDRSRWKWTMMIMQPHFVSERRASRRPGEVENHHPSTHGWIAGGPFEPTPLRGTACLRRHVAEAHVLLPTLAFERE